VPDDRIRQRAHESTQAAAVAAVVADRVLMAAGAVSWWDVHARAAPPTRSSGYSGSTRHVIGWPWAVVICTAIHYCRPGARKQHGHRRLQHLCRAQQLIRDRDGVPSAGWSPTSAECVAGVGSTPAGATAPGG
jgi:hypothetical protein